MVEDRTAALNESNRKLKRSEEELMAMNDAKNKFFGLISHDLRNPLKALNLTTAALHDHYETLDEAERRRIIRVINDSSQQTGVLLENLLLWVLSQMNMLKPHLKNVILQEQVEDCFELLKLTAAGKKIELQAEIPVGTMVLADPQLLSTILRNLITNAIHYSFEKSSVSVMAEEIDSLVKITVVDYGVGMTEENRQRLFRVDMRVHTRGTKNEQGSGLGLIITNEFVHLQGGTLTVESVPMKGSRFTFTLKKYIAEDETH